MLPKIFVKETEDRKSFVKNVLERFAEEFRGKKVFVKPNLVSYEPYPTTTHPEVLREVLRILIDNECEVIVGAAPARTSGNAEMIVENHPLNMVCGEFDVELANLHEEGFRKMKTKSGFSLRVSTVPLEYDYIISLPVLKSHSSTSLTGALKNQFSFLQNRERYMMHGGLKNIHRSTAELNTLIKPDFFIMDAVLALSGSELRHGGIQSRIGYMLAGKDPVALDCFGLELLKKVDERVAGKNPEDIAHIKHAIQLGLGSKDFEKVYI